jgi:mannose-6-phosphate isomerase-like protein (cupin superfamily)
MGYGVVGLKEGQPRVEGSLRIWDHFGAKLGADAISLRVLELASDATATLHNETCDEVLYVLDGRGVVHIDGEEYSVGPDTGIYLRPDSALTLNADASGPMTVVSSRCPDPEGSLKAEPPEPILVATKPVVRLEERQPQRTGDRWYRELVNEQVGSTQVTQFVGGIPPGRAPDHFHLYEEVICIIEGSGVVWGGRASTPIAPGSCIFLPRRQVHCLENTGSGELRLLGIFYPAGSPAVRYSVEDRAGDAPEGH